MTANSKIFKISRPERKIPVVFDSPHSGRDYPADFAFTCPQNVLARAEDNYVDELFAAVPDYGATLLCALFPRSYIDVNRAADDIDPDIFDGTWPEPIAPTARSLAGAGLIRRLLKPGIPVYNRKLTVNEIRQRLDNYYHPYHAALEETIDELHGTFGQVWHINCHSMPAATGAMIADFVLGDREGTSCASDFTKGMRDFLRGLGYSVALNHPYKGVEIVRRHAAPADGRHSIQLEISKGLYWNEEKGEKNRNFKRLQSDIGKLCGWCADFAESKLVSLAAD